MQSVILAVALALWALWGAPVFAALALCYAAAWLGANILVGFKPTLRRVSGPWPLVGLAAGCIAAANTAARQADEIIRNEQLSGLANVLSDRARLQQTPSIAPPIVFADSPQHFFVNAPGAEHVNLSFGDSASSLRGVDIGSGLFRVAYDPREHGVPWSRSGPFDAHIEVNGVGHKRQMEAFLRAAHPRWLHAAPDGGWAVTVSEETDTLMIVDRSGHIAIRPVGDGPTAAVVAGEFIAVTHRYDTNLWMVDRSGRVKSKIHFGAGQRTIAAAPDGSAVAVALDAPQSGIRIVQLPSLAITATIATAIVADHIAFGPTATTLVVSDRRAATLHRLVKGADALARWREIDAPIRLGRPVVTLTRSRDGTAALLAVTDDLPTGAAGANHGLNDQLVAVDVRRWRITHRRSTARSGADGVVSGASPMGIAPLADGTLLVAFAGTDEITRLDAVTFEPTSSIRAVGSADGVDQADGPNAADDRVATLMAPHGVADLGEGVWAATSPATGTIIVARDRETIATHGASLTGSALSRGERAFYETTRAGISCQSCHLHADSDLAMHDIGHDSPRPTLSVRGVAQTAPYLRGASYPTLRDLDTFPREVLGGYARHDPLRSADVRTYIRGLPPPHNPLRRSVSNAALRAGISAFVKARCNLCHSFPAFTNLSQHPESFLFGGRRSAQYRVDTPSLIGVSATGPFLHDGRAGELQDVLRSHNASDRHGNVAALSPDEEAALIGLLRCL